MVAEIGAIITGDKFCQLGNQAVLVVRRNYTQLIYQFVADVIYHTANKNKTNVIAKGVKPKKHSCATKIE